MAEVGHLKTSKVSYLFSVKMINTILGLKKEMSARFNEQGHRIPVTAILADPNIILGIFDSRARIGFGKKKKIKRTESAFVKVCGFAPRFVKEVPIIKSQEESPSSQKYSPGEKVTVSIFEPGDLVKITGTTKGKGFAGAIKRWGFAQGPKTHGQSDRHRAPGSIGATTTPGRVLKGKKMAGHMGASQKTITNLEVSGVDPVNNLLIVKGAVPGARNGFLVIEKTGKVKKHIPLYSKDGEKKEGEIKESKSERIKESKEIETATTEDTENKTEGTEETSNTKVNSKSVNNDISV